jgi:hypothetical protein
MKYIDILEEKLESMRQERIGLSATNRYLIEELKKN